MIFLNTPDDCQWLRETHLKHVCNGLSQPPFDSFTLMGTEDCPTVISLYAATEPVVTDWPVAVLVLDPKTGDYQQFPVVPE